MIDDRDGGRVASVLHALIKQLQKFEIAWTGSADGDKKLIQIDGLNACFGENRSYQILDGLKCRYGVYVIIDESNEVMYVGESHCQNMKRRIMQNFTEKNRGGTFRKNWLKKNGGEFDRFQQMLAQSQIVTISSKTKNALWIELFEQMAIFVLRPRYNRRHKGEGH